MDPTPDLISAADQQLRWFERLIEQQRLHIAAVHPSRRAPENRTLQRLLAEYVRLRESRAQLSRRKTAA